MARLTKVRHLATTHKEHAGTNDKVCQCMENRMLVKVKAEFTGDVDRIACIRCRKWFRP